MDLGTFAIVKVAPGEGDYDTVLLEGLIPPGGVMPANLLVYVKKPHDFAKHQAIALKAEWQDYGSPAS